MSESAHGHKKNKDTRTEGGSTDLVHLERGQDGLDQHRRPDAPSPHANRVLSEVEDVVPESGFQVGLHLGQVEVGPRSPLDQFVGVVVEVQAKVEEARRDGLAVDRQVLLLEMPAPRPDEERRRPAVRPQLVLLASLPEVDPAAHGVVEVDLTVDHVVPRRRARVLEVGHVRRDVRVQGVDDHLTVGRAGDLDAAVDEARSRRGAPPAVVVADTSRLGEEVGQEASVELGLAGASALEEMLAGGVERSMQQRQKRDGIATEYLARRPFHRSQDAGAQDADTLQRRVDGGHAFDRVARAEDELGGADENEREVDIRSHGCRLICCLRRRC